MIAMPGEPHGSPAHTLHEVSYGWTRHGSDLVHRTTGAVLRGQDAAVGWADPGRLADPALGAMGNNQLNRDDLLTWLLERGALLAPVPWLAQGPGWQELTDQHGATRWVWNSPDEATQELPSGLRPGRATGLGMRCLIDSLSQLMQPLLPPEHRAAMTVEFLSDWLERHLPLDNEARAQLLAGEMVDVWRVLPVFTSMFGVRVQVFRHAEDAREYEWTGRRRTSRRTGGSCGSGQRPALPPARFPVRRPNRQPNRQPNRRPSPSRRPSQRSRCFQDRMRTIRSPASMRMTTSR
jgi:hypothetical protein